MVCGTVPGCISSWKREALPRIAPVPWRKAGSGCWEVMPHSGHCGASGWSGGAQASWGKKRAAIPQGKWKLACCFRAKHNYFWKKKKTICRSMINCSKGKAELHCSQMIPVFRSLAGINGAELRAGSFFTTVIQNKSNYMCYPWLSISTNLSSVLIINPIPAQVLGFPRTLQKSLESSVALKCTWHFEAPCPMHIFLVVSI